MFWTYAVINNEIVGRSHGYHNLSLMLILKERKLHISVASLVSGNDALHIINYAKAVAFRGENAPESFYVWTYALVSVSEISDIPFTEL